MLLSVKSVFERIVLSADNEIGDLIDLYFNDERWEVDYLVVDTHPILPARKVLISPLEIKGITRLAIELNLTEDRIKSSPDISHKLPVSRQHEHELRYYFGWPIEEEVGAGEKRDVSEEERRLRSAKETKGYRVAAADGEIGHVEDFIVDSEAWAIRYAAVDTVNWAPGKKVLVAPPWINRIDWENRTMGVDMVGDQIKNSPEYDPSQAVNRVYEEQLYDYYGRPRYWQSKPVAESAR